MKIQLKTITEYQEKQCDLFSKFSVFSSLEEYKKYLKIEERDDKLNQLLS